MKQTCRFLLTALFALFSFINSFAAKDRFLLEDLYYKILSDEEVEVIGPTGNHNLDVEIPETIDYEGKTYRVVSIGDYAFSSNSNHYLAKTIKIPTSVKNIGERAFDACYSLTAIDIPSSVTNIGDYAFAFCLSLKSVTIGSGVTDFGLGAFMGCKQLSSVIFADGATIVGEACFYNCPALTSVIIPNSIKEIEQSAFYACANLPSIELSDSLESIGMYAFYGCMKVPSIAIPIGVSSIGRCAFASCFDLVSITVSEGNSYFDSRDNCHAIVESATNKLVAGCQTTVIPNSVDTIGYGAFYGCVYLSSITIPANIKHIENHAFGYCYNMDSIISLSATPPSTYDDVFNKVDAKLYVPYGSKQAYLQAVGWNTLKEIVELEPSNVQNTMRKELQPSIFDIMGRRLEKPQRGINIIRGKKLVKGRRR